MHNTKCVQIDLKISLPFFTDENLEFDDKSINEICDKFNTFFQENPTVCKIDEDKYEIKATPVEFQTKYDDMQKGIEFSFKGYMTIDVTPGTDASPECPACDPKWIYTPLEEFKKEIEWASKQISFEPAFNDFIHETLYYRSDVTLWGYPDISEKDYDDYIQEEYLRLYCDYEYSENDKDDR